MARKPKSGKQGRRITAAEFMAAVPHVNAAIKATPNADGTRVEVPMQRPKYLVPPISWFLPYSSHRRIQLDKLGTAVLKLCDGQRSVEQIIVRFATDNKLTYREAQLPVTQFLQMLVERGIAAIVGLDEKAGSP